MLANLTGAAGVEKCQLRTENRQFRTEKGQLWVSHLELLPGEALPAVEVAGGGPGRRILAVPASAAISQTTEQEFYIYK